jgi:WD40 repeat protein
VAKNDRGTPDNTPDAERIQRWRWMLEQNVPLIGGWMHRRITSALTESAVAGNWLATQSLAVVMVFHQEPDVRRQAAETLRRINYATGIDAVWGVWAETRNPELESIAVGYNRIASHPASVRLLSALRLNAISTVTHGSADLVPALVQACTDSNEYISTRAHESILKLHNQASIDALCAIWLQTRPGFLDKILKQAGYAAQKPSQVRVYSALKVGKLEIILQARPDMVAALVEACQDRDADISDRARLCLVQLQKQSAIDEFCRLWSESRSPLLEQALLEAGYKARNPLQVRLLVALKTGFLAAAEEMPAEGLPFLLNATQDADETIRKNACHSLSSLKNEETREAVCMLVISNDDPLARKIALENQYIPRTADLRALFYFLTEQWSEYDELDFDQRLMRAIYEASSHEVRRRIADRVQTAGRTDYLTILAGVDYRARAEEVSEREAELLISILSENREYARLWALASELALPFGIKIVNILAAAGWHPSNEIDQTIFADLTQLANQPIWAAGGELTRALPLAIPRATLKLRGRVNEVAFSPEEPVLAIGTSQRKVVLWNFKTAAVEQVIEGFDHSIGKVSYTPRGVLAIAERTNAQAQCTVHIRDNGEAYSLCTHVGTVTSLEPVGENNLLTTGRDGKGVLWDLYTRQMIASKEFSFWPRAAAISPDNQYAALLHDRFNLVRLPDMSLVPGYPFLTPRADGFKHGVAQNASFSPDGKFLLAGQYNGQVGLYFHTSLTQRPRKAVVTQHSQPIRGIHFLPGHPLVITAGTEGQVRFIRWPDMSLLGTVYSPEGRLTSLRLSHQGAFMATGTSDASLVLWDLRVLDIPDLFSQPLATATHDQISNVLALSEYHSLPEPVRNGLRFLRLLLQYRFRYDIQIEEAPTIQFGEFDIMLDES